MSLNISKCYSIFFYKSRSSIQFKYSLNNIQHESLTNIKNLSITFSYNFNFDQYIENSTSKTKNFRIWLYGIHNSKSVIDRIEYIQIRISKCIFYKFYTPIENHNYSPILSNFNIKILSLCYKLSDITFIYKLINEYINSPSLLN